MKLSTDLKKILNWSSFSLVFFHTRVFYTIFAVSYTSLLSYVKVPLSQLIINFTNQTKYVLLNVVTSKIYAVLCVVQTTRLSSTLMEAVKAILAHVSTTEGRVAIRAEQKNYSYVQLIDSALSFSDLLLGTGAINVSVVMDCTYACINHQGFYFVS